MRLSGKLALVTGSARERGIGRGIAECLAEEGCDVVVNDVASAENEALELVTRLRERGRRAIWHCADVSDRAQVDHMFQLVENELGTPDIVCSNAGVASWHSIEEVTAEDWETVVGVNLHGAFNVCQAGARAMAKAGSPGRIVITSSVHVQMPFPQMSVYGATKAGLASLAEVAAIELAPLGITVNHIGPGWVRSYINDESPDLQTEEEVRQTLSLIPGGRAAEPRDLGRAVVYLSSSDGDHVTGEYLRVDGGFVVGKH